MKTVSRLIEFYGSELNIKGNALLYSNETKLLKRFSSEVRSLCNVEDEIISYLMNSISSRKWEKDYDLWFIAMHEHSSEIYLDFLLCILQENDVNFPHWKTLDVLSYMPRTISEKAVPRLTQIIESNNPFWSERDLMKAFETLIWIGNKEAMDFISRASNLSTGKVVDVAKYWSSWLADEEC